MSKRELQKELARARERLRGLNAKHPKNARQRRRIEAQAHNERMIIIGLTIAIDRISNRRARRS